MQLPALAVMPQFALLLRCWYQSDLRWKGLMAAERVTVNVIGRAADEAGPIVTVALKVAVPFATLVLKSGVTRGNWSSIIEKISRWLPSIPCALLYAAAQHKG